MDRRSVLEQPAQLIRMSASPATASGSKPGPARSTSKTRPPMPAATFDGRLGVNVGNDNLGASRRQPSSAGLPNAAGAAGFSPPGARSAPASARQPPGSAGRGKAGPQRPLFPLSGQSPAYVWSSGIAHSAGAPPNLGLGGAVNFGLSGPER